MKCHKKILGAAITAITCGCASVSLHGPEYQGGNLSTQFYLTRDVKAENYATIPASAKKFTIDKDFVELDNIDGVTTEKLTQSLVYNEFTLAAPRRISLTISADWQFKVFLNGNMVFDSFKHHKNPPLYYIHQVDIDAAAGKNLLTVEVTRGATSSLFYFAEGVKKGIDLTKPLQITAHPAAAIGKIKPMNAVNNAPITGNTSQIRTNLKWWQQAKIPYARNHDASISGYGSAHIVDVHMIFPDFSKDPYDPQSYDFTLSDIYHQKILQGGTKIFYRLGSRIEHSIVKYGTKKPADFKKWAIICEHIIRHYTEGWANGFKWDIQYWEIWNEPDLSSGKENKKTWGGTDEEFFEMYRIAALHLKKKFPHLKIGGPALAGRIPWMRRFLAEMSRSERVPIDFFSWHIYTADLMNFWTQAVLIRTILDQYGYKNTESILNEWNYVRGWKEDFVYSIKSIIGIKGAAFSAAAMTVMQNNPVDMAMYYDARPCAFNGLFDFYTCEPLKTYHVFRLWAKLADLGTQFKIDIPENPEVFAVGATDNKGNVGIMFSRFVENDQLPPPVEIKLNASEYALHGAKLYLLDGENNLSEKPLEINRDGTVTFHLAPNTVIYLEKNKAE